MKIEMFEVGSLVTVGGVTKQVAAVYDNTTTLVGEDGEVTTCRNGDVVRTVELDINAKDIVLSVNGKEIVTNVFEIMDGIYGGTCYLVKGAKREQVYGPFDSGSGYYTENEVIYNSDLTSWELEWDY